MIAAVMHIAFSRPWSIYKSQVLNKFASPAHRNDMDVDVLSVTTVGEVIEPCEIKTLRGDEPLSVALKYVDLNYAYPVYEGKTYIGLLDMSVAKSAYIASPDLIQHLLVSDCTVKAPLLLLSTDLHTASKIFARFPVDKLCVKNDQGEVVGALSHGAIFKAYDRIVKA